MSIADIEEILVAGLKAAAPLSSISGKISTELPAGFKAEKRIQLFRIDSAPVDPGSEAAHRPLVQVNLFGATKDESNDLAATTYDVIRGFEGQMVGGAWLGAVDLVTGPAWDPDPSTGYPRNIMRFGILTRKRSA